MRRTQSRDAGEIIANRRWVRRAGRIPEGINRRCPPSAFVVVIAIQFGEPDAGTTAVALWGTLMLLGQRTVSDGSSERRAVRRFTMRLPASVRVPGIPSEFPTETENVSARGLFFYLPAG